MKNIVMKRDGNKLVLTIDLTKDCGPSKSGKTMVVASTYGNVLVEGEQGMYLGVNCYKTR